MVTFGGVKEKTFQLIEQGEYVLTLSELEESEGQWGDRMVWKFLVAPKEDFAAYICNANGDERTLWAFTDRDIILGSLGHEFVENLTRRKFSEDSDPPDEDDLLGKRILAYVTHETPTRGKAAGKKREAIVAGSIKPFVGPSKKVWTGKADDVPDVDRAALIEETKKQIRKAAILDLEPAERWAVLDLDAMTDKELVDGLQTIKDAIAAA